MTDRRTQVLEATCKLVSQKGIRGLSIQQVAGEMSLPVAELERYFSGDAALLAAAFDHADGRASAFVADQVQGEDALDRLVHLLTCYIDDAPEIREDWIFWIELEAGALFDPVIHELVTHQSGTWLAMIAGLIYVVMAGGYVRSGIDAEASALRLVLIQDSLAKQCAIGWIEVEDARIEMTHAIELELGIGAAVN